jgi:opacity protein-like surface antigen
MKHGGDNLALRNNYLKEYFMYTGKSKAIPASILLSAALGFSSMGQADACDNIQSYLGGDLSYNKVRYGNNFKDGHKANGMPRSRGPGLGVIGGIRYYENYGAEVGFTMLREIKNNTSGASNNLRSRNAYLDLLGYFPVANQMELVGSLGLGHMRTLGKLSRTGARIGAGGQYNLDNRWSIRTMVRYQKIGGKAKDSSAEIFKKTSSVNLSVFYLL